MSTVVAPTDCRHALPADTRFIRPASAWLAQCGVQLGVPEAQIQRLDLCLNEVLANIIYHGGESALAQPVELEMAVREHAGQQEAALTISDCGLAFDPTAAQPTQRPTSLMDAQIGGLGIIMMQTNADAMAYRRVEARNVLTLTVRWPLGA